MLRTLLYNIDAFFCGKRYLKNSPLGKSDVDNIGVCVSWGAVIFLLFLSLAARGQGFNPASPGEPNPTYALKVKADPEEAATVTGAGRYAINKNVTVSATATSTEWKLINWTNSAGNEVSTSSSFTYKTVNADETFTAHYVKVNTSTLTMQSYPANVFKSTTNTYKEGASVNVSCNTYSGYAFKNWTNSKGEVVSTDRSFYYTVTASDEVLTANYAFTPSSPSEPSETKAKHRVWFTSDPTSVNYFSQTSGMQVTVYKDAGLTQVVETITTDAGGYGKSSDLPYGTYYARETAAPAGYKIMDHTFKVVIGNKVTVDGETTGTARIVDECIRKKISVQKYDKEKGTAKPNNTAVTFKGAEYTIYEDAQMTKVLEVLTTDESGKAESIPYPYETYYVKETQTPTGYLLDEIVYKTYKFSFAF